MTAYHTAYVEELEELYQQAPCGYLSTTDDGTITRVNDTFLAWTGHRREDLLGSRIHQLLPVGDKILYSTHCMPQLRLMGAVAEVLVEVLTADRTRRAALLTAARTPPVGDRPASVRVIVFGAHERRRYELELVDALRRAEASDERRDQAEATMRHLALHDSLTDLPNRAGLIDQLQALLADRGAIGDRHADTTATNMGALFIDLDHFKAVNDSLGHSAGDELLTVVARRLRRAVRDAGIVARLSGDEFVVVDHVVDAAQVERLARRLLDVITAPVVIQDLEIVVSASIGAALASGAAHIAGTADAAGSTDTSDARDAAELLLRHADVAMHRAKAHGRNCVEVHDPNHTDPAADRLTLLGQLRRGIDYDQLRVHYQPRVDLRTGRLAGVEALVRWQHPDRGLLPPSEFIDIAEESGLVRRLGAWVLHESIRQAAQWAAAFNRTVPVEMAVNLSTRQLTDPDLLPTITDALRRHGLDPALLTLEVTETALMDDPDAAAITLTQLKAVGVSLAVDDFGTGYASLTYLQRFAIDELKIDRSFVNGLGTDSGDSAIVGFCVHLAHAMGITAVAEGVETDEQRQALAALDCDFAQGYFYARPLPPDELACWITDD